MSHGGADSVNAGRTVVVELRQGSWCEGISGGLLFLEGAGESQASDGSEHCRGRARDSQSCSSWWTAVTTDGRNEGGRCKQQENLDVMHDDSIAIGKRQA